MSIIRHPCFMVWVLLAGRWLIFVSGWDSDERIWASDGAVNIGEKLVCNKERLDHCFPVAVIGCGECETEFVGIMTLFFGCGERGKEGHGLCDVFRKKKKKDRDGWPELYGGCVGFRCVSDTKINLVRCCLLY